LLKEIVSIPKAERKINSVYFGGGTPSLLTVASLEIIFACLQNEFVFSDSVEVTFEMNPDDLSEAYLKSIFDLGLINRLSIGIQSLTDINLQFLSRFHTAEQISTGLDNVFSIGFKHVSVDYIYGYPLLNNRIIGKELKILSDFPVEHFSCYHLSYEPGTLFYKYLQSGKLTEISDTDSLNQYEFIVNGLSNLGFKQYEISNFCKSGFESKHNSNYWNNSNYYGFGPSAHSYDGQVRRINDSNVFSYISKLNNSETDYCKLEQLSETDKYNEFIMTSLRTISGINKQLFEQKFPNEYIIYFKQNALNYIKNRQIIENELYYYISAKSLFVSDSIITDLFFV